MVQKDDKHESSLILNALKSIELISTHSFVRPRI